MVNENKEKNDMYLLEYKKYGFGKTGFCTYQFCIDKDYQMEVNIRLDQEVRSFSISSMKEKLTDEEKKIVDSFIGSVINPKFKEVCTIYQDDCIKYEGSSLSYGDIIIDDDEVTSKFLLMKEMLQDNHIQFSNDCIFSMFSFLEENTINREYQRVR